jgi:hypothetical protein
VYLPCLTSGQAAVPKGDSLLATCPVFGDHLNTLLTIARKANEDCPAQYRTRHFREALKDAFELAAELQAEDK